MSGTVLASVQLASGLIVQLSGYERHLVTAVTSHPQPYVCLVIKGIFKEWTPRGFHRRVPGSLHFHPAHEPNHGIIGNQDVEVVSIVAPSDLKLTEDCVQLADIATGRLPYLARTIGEIARSRRTQKDRRIESLGIELFQEYAVYAVRQAKVSPPWLSQAKALLSQGTQTQRVAEECEIHPASFARSFRHWAGISPGEFVRQKRIEGAIARLQTGKDTIGEIAMDLGFSDQSHLSRELRRRYRACPSDFRSR